jgi:signal transduction histidine kinase
MPQRDVGRGWRRRVVRASGWAAHLPLAFVMLTLVALVALPLAAERYVRPFNRELRDLVEPARGHVTDVHVYLAIEGSTFHDYLDGREPELLERYQQTYAKELRAYEDLDRLTSRLGDTVRVAYGELRRLERQWHATVARLLSETGSAPGPRRAAIGDEDVFEELLLAAAQLDHTLSGASMRRRQAINEAERVQRRITVVIGIVTLIAVAGVAWLAQRVRVYARDAEEQRVAVERAQESRARLIRGVSHDLKNPLGAIDGHAALLEDGIKGPLTSEQREGVTRIRHSVLAVLGLITDLLELSKAEAGHLTLRPRPTNVADVVRETAEEHRDAAAAAGHELRVEIDDGLPVIQTDPDRVRQVLGNLLSNALKYTPSGGRIVVRLEERAGLNGRGRARRCAAIDVVDTGPGIPADKLGEIFEEFSRLGSGPTPGTGLGLTIARRISHLLGGDVTAASELGRGATFTLWLPMEA